MMGGVNVMIIHLIVSTKQNEEKKSVLLQSSF